MVLHPTERWQIPGRLWRKLDARAQPIAACLPRDPDPD